MVIFSLLSNSNISRIPVGDLPDGVYLLRISNMQGEVIRTERLTKTSR